ncbi:MULTISPECIES: hypothetical protein [Xenorhabdus]|uniref:hypothetical protein n=1 Tax=Xenorhabdus TaxID=626 RepID=UPI000649BD6A|nr:MULTISPECIES: hypothetical protein [Xenorhabdus]KLU17161.1 hypothetical protein AAY47_01730 [Xenorhabdus griffiniae]KOP32764.1 hypothetical protein AFK69_13730 [Xenorhabdus sp. GDc328]
MAHGFELRRSHGILQVDGRYQNMNLTIKESVVAQGGYVENSTYRRIGVNTSFSKPVPPTTTITAVDSDNWINSAGGIKQAAGAGKANVTLYGFGTNKQNWFNSQYGLSVRNEQGQEVYNSNWAVMKVVDVFNLGFVRNWSYKIPAGKKYALMMGGGREEYQMGYYSNNAYGCWHEFRRIGDRFEIRYNENTMWWFRDEDEISYVAQDYDLNIIILDVTGY